MRLKAAEPYAIDLLQHANATVRREAVGVLGYLQDAENLPKLMAIAANDTDPEVRRTAVGTLVFGEACQVSDALVHALQDAYWQVRTEAAKGLGRLKIMDAVEPLIDATRDPLWQVRERAAEALGKLGLVGAIPALGACLDNDNGNLRKTAVAALGEIAHPDGLGWVDKAMQDPDPDVRKLARWAKERMAA